MERDAELAGIRKQRKDASVELFVPCVSVSHPSALESLPSSKNLDIKQN